MASKLRRQRVTLWLILKIAKISLSCLPMQLKTSQRRWTPQLPVWIAMLSKLPKLQTTILLTTVKWLHHKMFQLKSPRLSREPATITSLMAVSQELIWLILGTKCFVNALWNWNGKWFQPSRRRMMLRRPSKMKKLKLKMPSQRKFHSLNSVKEMKLIDMRMSTLSGMTLRFHLISLAN